MQCMLCAAAGPDGCQRLCFTACLRVHVGVCVCAMVAVMLQVLLLLKDVLNPSVKLLLNPQMELSELPLKSFYRCVQPN